MQYRLSTIFLVFFVVAASLAAFETWGLAISGIIFLFAYYAIHRAKSVFDGILNGILVFFGTFVISIFIIGISTWNVPIRLKICSNNLRHIGTALHSYLDKNEHFPPVYTTNPEGKLLHGWLVEILPYMDYGSVYDSFNSNEPWNSADNAKLMSSIYEYSCPIAYSEEKRERGNYIAVIGPGTIWKSEGAIKLSDLPAPADKCVVAVEVLDSGTHWAAPFAITAEEILENMRRGKGVRVSSNHYEIVHVLFADGTVRGLPSKMPLSIWRKILAGKMDDFENIESQFDPNAPDMVDTSGTPTKTSRIPLSQSLGILVWIISVVWLFYRAAKSRKIITLVSPDVH